MGLSNGAKKARNYSRIIVRNQGGGPEKAGLPYQVGRVGTAMRAMQCVYIRNKSNAGCCDLARLQMTSTPAPQYNRGIGAGTGLHARRFAIPGTKA